MKNEILQQDFKAIIAELKRESSYYPSVLIKYYEAFEKPKEDDKFKNRPMTDWVHCFTKTKHKEVEKVCYASTLVRIKRGGQWYVVHCVESIKSQKEAEQRLLSKMMNSVHKIQWLYQILKSPNDLQDVDTSQMSETERLTLLSGGKF